MICNSKRHYKQISKFQKTLQQIDAQDLDSRFEKILLKDFSTLFYLKSKEGCYKKTCFCCARRK